MGFCSNVISRPQVAKHLVSWVSIKAFHLWKTQRVRSNNLNFSHLPLPPIGVKTYFSLISLVILLMPQSHWPCVRRCVQKCNCFRLGTPQKTKTFLDETPDAEQVWLGHEGLKCGLVGSTLGFHLYFMYLQFVISSVDIWIKSWNELTLIGRKTVIIESCNNTRPEPSTLPITFLPCNECNTKMSCPKIQMEHT